MCNNSIVFFKSEPPVMELREMNNLIYNLMFLFTDETPQPSPSSNESMPSYCKNDDGDIFLTAESWKPNVCTSCICMDGVIRCYSESCPPVSCERPVLRKGQCCPYCIGEQIKIVINFLFRSWE